MSTPTILITGGCSYSQIPNADVAWPLPLQESLGVRYVAHTGHGAAGNQLISRKVISKVIKSGMDIVGVDTPQKCGQDVIDIHITVKT